MTILEELNAMGFKSYREWFKFDARTNQLIKAGEKAREQMEKDDRYYLEMGWLDEDYVKRYIEPA